MRGHRVLKIIELILQVVTIISSIFAIKEIIKTYQYKCKLREKAKAYLDDELGELQHLKRKVLVFSPELKEQEGQIKKLLSIVIVGILSLFTISTLKRD